MIVWLLNVARERGWELAAVGAWSLLLGITFFKPLVKPVSGTIYPTYAHAGEEFAAERRLYDVPHPHTDNFRYSPLVAASFVPFSWLSLGVGGMLWRILSAAVFVAALAAWFRRVAPTVSLAKLFLVAIPVSIGSLHNGQANTLVIGLMLGSTLLAADSRWGWSAVLVAGAVLFKIFPLAFALLLTLAAPLRFGVPLTLTLLAGIVLPFAFGSSEYVADQYRFWFENLGRDDRTSFPLHAGLQDVHMLLRVAGLEIPLAKYRYLQAATGGLVGLYVLRRLIAGTDRHTVPYDAFALSTCWMLTFGPSVETSTFILIAPLLARELLDPVGRTRWSRTCAIAGMALFVIARLALAMPRVIHQPIIALGVQPLAAVFVAIAVCARLAAGNRTARSELERAEWEPSKRAA